MNQRLVRFPFSIISLVSVETPFYGSIDGPSYGSKTDNRTAVPLPFLNEAMVCIRASRRIAEATMPGRMWYATLCPVPSCDISTKIFPAKEKDIGGWLSVSCQVWRYRLGSLLIDRVSWASPFEENGASAPYVVSRLPLLVQSEGKRSARYSIIQGSVASCGLCSTCPTGYIARSPGNHHARHPTDHTTLSTMDIPSTTREYRLPKVQ